MNDSTRKAKQSKATTTSSITVLNYVSKDTNIMTINLFEKGKNQVQTCLQPS